MAQPKDGEVWLLVTSAFHMPRAVGCFRQAGWRGFVPYPVGYITPPDVTANWSLAFTFDGRMWALNAAIRELAGLVYYRLAGRTDSLVPGM